MGEKSHNLEALQMERYFNAQATVWDSRVTGESRECLAGICADIGIPAGGHVLDTGAGTGVLVPFLAAQTGPPGLIVELDVSAEMLRKAMTKDMSCQVLYIQADVHRLPFPEGSFNTVICNNALPHFAAKDSALAEMARVLMAGGRLAVCHTMSREAVNALHHRIGGVVGHHTLPDDDVLRALLAGAGLTVLRLEDGPRRYLAVAEKPSMSS